MPGHGIPVAGLAIDNLACREYAIFISILCISLVLAQIQCEVALERRGLMWRAALGLVIISGLISVLVLSLAPGLTPPAVWATPAGASLSAASLPAAVPAGKGFAHILRVPAQYPTIQAAVNAARPGDLILISPGVYHEAVKVQTPSITIRGLDRNRTVLDGESRLPAGFTVTANDVTIENITAHHYAGNGFFWNGVNGYRGDYLTAYDNGDYGIYAFGSINGEFAHDYASGSPDAGFYIGQCFPCNALITDVTAEWNGLGYSGTNAGGNLTIAHSRWLYNGAGILPNTLDSEGMPPQRGVTIINNYVAYNGNTQAPMFPLEYPLLGVGIGVPGGNLNYIAYNRVVNNTDYGILVLSSLDKHFWLTSDNVVEHNWVSGSGVADIALATPSGSGNCFADNRAAITLPPLLEVIHPCGSPLALNSGGDPGIALRLLARVAYANGAHYPIRDYRTVAAPPAQPDMPDIAAPPPATLAITTTPTGLPAAVGRGGMAMLQPLGFTSYTIVQILLSLYGNFLLFAIYAAWLAIAFWDLGHRLDMAGSSRFSWGIVIVALPIIGPIAYYALGGSKLSGRFRLGLVVGAPLLCIALTAVLMVIASLTV